MPSAATDHSSEYRWHILARWILVGFLALGAFVAGLRHLVAPMWPLLALCASIGLYNLVFAMAPWSKSRWAAVSLISLVMDLVSLTIYLHLSGDVENPLIFAYSLPVVAGAVLLTRRHGFLLASCATLLFAALLGFTYVDALQHALPPLKLIHHHLSLIRNIDLHYEIDPDSPGRNMDFILSHFFVLSAVLFGSAYGFGILAERIREKEVALRQENERVRLLLGMLPEGVVLMEKDGSVLVSNPAARQVLGGLDRGTVHGLNGSLEISDRVKSFQGPVEEFETAWKGRVLGHALARGSREGPLVWVFRDLTEQRRLMAQVVHRSKMADLGLLAAGIAHEIGNPLSSMSAIIQVLEMKKAAPELSDRLRALGSHVERIDRIVKDVTSFARPSAEKRVRVGPGALVEKALAIFRFHEKAKGRAIDIAPFGRTARVEVVEDQLVQVLLNLLLNAADASSDAGTIRIVPEETDSESRLSVVDQGAGMSDEEIRHLFTPFYTTKEPGKGVGLGLSVSESIVRSHGGRIEVQSAPGKGSVFTVCLPRVKEGA